MLELPRRPKGAVGVLAYSKTNNAILFTMNESEQQFLQKPLREDRTVNIEQKLDSVKKVRLKDTKEYKKYLDFNRMSITLGSEPCRVERLGTLSHKNIDLINSINSHRPLTSMEVDQLASCILKFPDEEQNRVCEILLFYSRLVNPGVIETHFLPFTEGEEQKVFEFLERCKIFYENIDATPREIMPDTPHGKLLPDMKKLYLNKIKKIIDSLVNESMKCFEETASLNEEIAYAKFEDVENPNIDQSGNIQFLMETNGQIDASFTKFVNEQTALEAQFLAMLALVRVNFQNGSEISINDIRDANLEIVLGSSLVKTDVTAMRRMYQKNQKDSAILDTLIASFDARVSDPNTRFYIYKWKGRIVGFLALTDLEGSKYFSSFNVDTNSQGFKIGDAMLHEFIGQEAKEHVLTADCYAHVAITQRYLDTGWVAYKYEPEPDLKRPGGTAHVLHICRDDAHNKIYWGGNTSKEVIVARQVLPPPEVVVESAHSQDALHFEKLNQGYVLTRMFRDDLSRMYFAVFEPIRKRQLAHQESEEAVEDVAETAGA